MNVLLFALGSHGDVHPFVGIGLRLRERGHHVAVATNEYFKPLVDHANLEFIQCGTAEEYTRLATNPDLWHPMKSVKAVFGGTARYLRPMYEVARDFAQRDDAIIVASSLALGARVAQDKHGVPLATVHLSPSIFQSVHEPPKLPGLSFFAPWAPLPLMRGIYKVINLCVDLMIARPLNAFRAELDLPPVRNVIRDYWHSPLRVIGLFPEWFGAKQADWPEQVRLTGFPLYDEPDLSPISPELERFINDGDPRMPPIAFTPGSAMWQGRKFFDASVDACVRLNRRGLLLTRHRDHLPPALPPNVIHVHYAPFSRLLPRCAAFVHHAGIGSTAQALAAGVPQLMTPFTHDQPDNSARVVRLGCGVILKPSKYTGERAAEALRLLIDDQKIAAACGQVKSRFIGVDAIGQACDLIEELAPSSQRRPAAARIPA
ncbi:MAG: rhamnosyltransferase subunit [Phycisphaerales bacterium]|nr:rhamnosyltransferase subunit [Phycisphaerales bacterium]